MFCLEKKSRIHNPPPFHENHRFFFCCLSGIGIWKSETVAANRDAAINPLSTIRTRYGNSISNLEATRIPEPTQKFSLDCLVSADFLQREKPIRTFSIDTTSPIRKRSRTPSLQTPFPRLIVGSSRVSGANYLAVVPCKSLSWTESGSNSNLQARVSLWGSLSPHICCPFPWTLPIRWRG